LRVANDVLRFSLEIAMLVALSYSGFALGAGAWGFVLGIGLLFGAAAAALVAAGRAVLGIAFGLLVLVHLALTFPLGQRIA
jgi:hypothetical protein